MDDSHLDSHPVTADGAQFILMIKEAAPGNQDQWAVRPGEQHNCGANLAYADGHVAPHRWRWSRKVGGSNVPVYAKDQADFRFLKDHLPKPRNRAT